MSRKSTQKKRQPDPEEEEASTASEELVHQHDVDDDDGSDEASGSGSEEEQSESGQSESGEEASDDDDAMDDASDDNNNSKTTTTTTALLSDGTTEQHTHDLSNLLSFNTHQINSVELYSKGKNKAEWYHGGATIESTIPINESYLLNKAVVGTSQLLGELWKLEMTKTDVGLMAKLPTGGGGDELKLPRALPPPAQKQLTKWEQFALQRGISPKSKRSRKQFDEATGTWKHLTGSLQNKANAGPETWPIIEVKKNDDPNQDPWEKLREEKKSRVNKNVGSRMRNAERGGLLEKGSANKMAKGLKKMEKQRELSREKERKKGLVAPVGVPVDMKSHDAKRGKPATQLALKATQVSTASLGKFDKLREGEPERQLQKQASSKNKRKLDPSAIMGGGTNKKFLQTEAQKSQDILSRVINGSKEKERDVRKGKYAKGETAYDYDYDDGLSGGGFRKKKGRAGVGKMRKVTKKRIV